VTTIMRAIQIWQPIIASSFPTPPILMPPKSPTGWRWLISSAHLLLKLLDFIHDLFNLILSFCLKLRNRSLSGRSGIGFIRVTHEVISVL
jgi:hypothetical protein